MSLLRMRRTTDKELRTLDEVLLEFQTDLDNYVDANTDYNFKSLINSYCVYSYIYLYNTSRTLMPDKNAKDHMTYMNSIIAEACREMNTPYFHPTGMYSIIDKGVAYLVENGLQDSLGYVTAIIDDVAIATKEVADNDVVEK